MGNRKHIIVLLALVAAMLLGGGSAAANTISPESFGANGLGPGASNLSRASAFGLQLARLEVSPSTNADAIVASLAAAHLRLYPLMGLPAQLVPAKAATQMAQFVTSFAQRYGPGGAFWSQNPHLPYMPVTSYEIGNEPNIPVQYVADVTHLHWSSPSFYALVYEAARAALHRVDPSAMAVVGGLADSGTPGVSLVDDERWLAALPAGQVDAVGYHPYTFPVSFSEMYSDTQGLRQWMDSHGMAGAPLDINEFGACDVLPGDTLEVKGCAPNIPSAQWGSFVAAFTQWALCSPQLNVESVQPEYWGDESNTDINALLALVSSNGTLTPYGQDYLGEARWLTTKGCSLVRVSHVRVHRHLLTVIVRAAPAAGRVTVLAHKGHRQVLLHLAHHNRAYTLLRFKAKLGRGRWGVTVVSTPSTSYLTPQSTGRRVRIRR